ncbi:MAG: hypothetical protein ABIJ81_01265 [Patescibacteria group bacterium]
MSKERTLTNNEKITLASNLIKLGALSSEVCQFVRIGPELVLGIIANNEKSTLYVLQKGLDEYFMTGKIKLSAELNTLPGHNITRWEVELATNDRSYDDKLIHNVLVNLVAICQDKFVWPSFDLINQPYTGPME